MDGLKKTTREYMIFTLFFTLSMYVGTFTVNMESYGMISASFHILCSAAYIGGWQVLARRSPETLPKYYLAGSAFRPLSGFPSCSSSSISSCSYSMQYSLLK